MFSRRLDRLVLACLLLALTSLRGEEENVWPFYVRQSAEDVTAVQAVGPFFFHQAGPGSFAQQGLRPFFMETVSDGVREGSFLYPFFTWRREAGHRSFSFFQLVNTRTDDAEGATPAEARFDVWPFWFSRDTGDPATSYSAFFPFGGVIKHRLGRDRIAFTLFPLYAHTEKAGRHVTHAPWPFLRLVGGDGHHGFEAWPLFGRVARAGDYDRQFWLWPLFYQSARNLSAPVPEVHLGALPFYTRDTGPGYRNENFVWPFFGYSDRTAPYRYHETRWLWPFLVQGRGDDRVVNRWAPLYTHSVIKGTDKTWLLWPLYRHQRWQADGLAQEKTQLLFFFFWSLEQRNPDHPAGPAASKTHLWPFFSAWDNGAGHRQVQALSPFEVFFPNNLTVRRLWSPLFALYRYERRADATERHALLWDAVTWRRGPAAREFHLGPLAGYTADAAQERLALGAGLIGLRRKPGARLWRLFLFDFPAPASMKDNPAALP